MASSASSDEGEIRDGNGSVEKATTSLPQFNGTSVDRQDRIRSSNSTSTSPEHEYRPKDRRSPERSRSPYSDRPPRGSKRPRDDDYADRGRGDPRRFKVHYEDVPKDYTRRPRVSYEDLDRGSSDLRYDDRDRYAEKRPRTRSRSPYRSSRGSERNGYAGQSRHGENRNGGPRDMGRPGAYGHGDVRHRDSRDQPVSKRAQSPLPADNAKHEAKITQGHSQQHYNTSASSLGLEK
jgi:serine/threonine-protein kinase PRP4